MLCESCDAPITEGEHCADCQERSWDRYQESLMEGGGGPTLLEQQQAAYKIKHGLR